jgi:hypothetical protein
MSFVLILVIVAVLVLAGLRLIRHDARARPGAESHDPPIP